MASSGTGHNPFDTSDDVNPFGTDAPAGLEHYDPFGGDAKPPSRSTSPPPADTSGLDFHDTNYGAAGGNNGYGSTNQQQYGSQDQFGAAQPSSGPSGQEPDVPLADDEEYEEYEEEDEPEEEVSVFSLAFYQSLFDVDTIQVLDRIFRSAVPFRKNFFEVVGKKPDFYGLVWVSATLVFLLAAAGNFLDFLRNKIWGSDFKYSFDKLPYAALAVYLFVALVPLLLWGALAWIDDFKLSLRQAYCLYGYAMFAFIPACIASLAPFNPVKWSVLAAATIISYLHIALSLWDILSLRRLVQLVALVLMAAAHVGMFLAFALYFFGTNPVPTPPTTAPVPSPPVAAPPP